MKEVRIKDPKTNGYYNMLEMGDYEYVNPIEKMSEVIVNTSMSMDRNHLQFAMENNLLLTPEIANSQEIINKVLLKNALSLWDKMFQGILSQKIPNGLFDILESSSKKEQIKILKGLSLTGDELLLFVFKAWENYGFTYSMYTSQHNHNGLDERDMPRFAHKEQNGDITTIGKTNLTEGQIKHAIDYRAVTVSKFLDKENIWHCFFLTFKSLKGEERGWEGKPHLHYISSNWGLSRDMVLSQLKSKNYKLPSPLPHIDFHTHRNPRSKPNE